MTGTPLWQNSARETAAATQNGDLSAVEAVEAVVARMRQVNPDLNAVVEDLGDHAIERAATLDKRRAAGGPCGPLHGVAVTIKINVDQTGHATSNGVSALYHNIAHQDAPIVRNLTKAGAVVIGRTNTPEFSFRADTDNPLHGRTHNPWGRHISPGGSSGGAAAAVMAGFGALAHGNDIGGSLRFPAAATGAVTLKPGLGRVPAYNQSQTTERGMLAQSMSVQGLITRSADDLHLSMPSIIAPDIRDPFHVPMQYRGTSITGPTRVAVSKENFGFDLHPEISHAIDLAADALSEAGYEVEEMTPPQVQETAKCGYRALMGEVVALVEPDIRSHGSNTIKAIFDEYFRQFSPHTGRSLLEAMAKRSFFAREWALFLNEYPILLCPFMLQPFFAPNRDAEGAEGVKDALGTALWSYSVNFVGLPAGCVPTHIATLPQGVQPINVQLIGQRWREDLLVDAMIEIEA
ncbi:MAG: amidase, partial [Paracoccaceae bacterium]|nr:amidase [Paracoccaceae bacterium]